MIIKLPQIPDGVYIDTEETAEEEIRRQTDQSFRAYSRETSKDWLFEDVLRYIDLLNKKAHTIDDFDKVYKDMLHEDLDWHIDNGDIPGEIEFQVDEEFCDELYNRAIGSMELGKHNYPDCYSNGPEERNIKKTIVLIIEQVIKTWRDMTCGK